MTIVEPSTKAHFHVVPPPSIAQKIGVFIFEEEEEEEDDSIFFDSLMRKRRRRDGSVFFSETVQPAEGDEVFFWKSKSSVQKWKLLINQEINFFHISLDDLLQTKEIHKISAWTIEMVKEKSFFLQKRMITTLLTDGQTEWEIKDLF